MEKLKRETKQKLSPNQHKSQLIALIIAGTVFVFSLFLWANHEIPASDEWLIYMTVGGIRKVNLDNPNVNLMVSRTPRSCCDEPIGGILSRNVSPDGHYLLAIWSDGDALSFFIPIPLQDEANLTPVYPDWRLINNDVFNTISLGFSPDSTQLVLATNLGLYLANLDGSNLHQILSIDTFRWFSEPSWSPDGTTIAFLGTDESQIRNLYVIDVDGQNLRAITNIDYAGHPSLNTPSKLSWSPDSSELVTFGRLSGETGVYIINVDTETIRPLIQGYENVGFSPIWSPDGQWIYFSAIWSNRQYSISRIRSDGAEIQHFPRTFAAELLWIGEMP
jgi:WD40 repeat protein